MDPLDPLPRSAQRYRRFSRVVDVYHRRQKGTLPL